MTPLHPGILALDLFTYLPAHKTLVLADLHLGFEERLARDGVLVPQIQFNEILARIKWAFKQVKVKKLILNGDIKHEFGRISRQEWNEIAKLVKFVQGEGVEVVAVRGNHDTIFGPVAKELNIQEVDEVRIGDVLIMHGDYIPKKLAPIIIIGHEHPAITLKDNAKREKFKCFVKAHLKKRVLIVQPSCNPFTQGTDITKENILSPLLAKSTAREVFIVDEKTREVLAFGKVSDL